MFICINSNGEDSCCGLGKTLEQCYKNYRDDVDSEISVHELTFYEADEIAVEFKIVKKLTLTKGLK